MLSTHKIPYINLIQNVWYYGAKWRKSIVGYYVAYVFAMIAFSFQPYTFGRAIDVLQNFKPERLNEIIIWLVLGVLTTLVFWIFHGPARVIERKVALKLQQDYRLKTYEQLTYLPLSWHQNHHSGSIITRFNRAALALKTFAENQFIYIEVIIKFIAALVFLCWISLPIGLISIVISFGIALTVILYDRVLIPLYDAQNEIDNHVGAVLFDYISNMTTVLTLRLGELTHNNLYQRMKKIWPFFRKDAVYNEAKWFTVNMLISSTQAILLIGYIVLSLHSTGAVLIGTLVMLLRYQWSLGEVFYELSMHYSDLVRMNTDLLGMQPIYTDIAKYAHHPQGEATARQWHNFRIANLSFGHANKADRGHVLDGVEFDVKRGEKIALIGESGGGKSTLLNLLSGLYTPSQVNLTIDGYQFDTLEPLQAITTLIPQDPEIFENTVEFNITMDLPTTPEEIHAAVKLSGFEPVLEALPQGLQTDIREKGLNFSVGQKQRLALARGIFAARYSSLILMDEPTSSVDLPTEKEILSGVIDAFPEAAMMVSLHRLHLLPKFDSVIMLKNGEVVASGKTADLLNNPGPVFDLWSAYQ